MASAKLKKLIKEDKEYLFQNYGNRFAVNFVKGNGSYLFDQDSNKYIDFLSGISVCNLGHNFAPVKSAALKQVQAISHSSNFFINKEQIEAAKLLSESAFPGKTLFLNSGTEANEAIIKLVRKYGLTKGKKHTEIITFNNSFHGRTYGSMSATGQSKIHDGFGPIVPGFIYLPYNDLAQFNKTVRKNKNITAVMMELIQGEGGIHIAQKKFVTEVYKICKEKDIVLVIDEIQTGIGRTGTPFAFQHYNIIPDAITLAKGLGNGIPIGAVHTKKYLAEYFTRGVHGSTFGGNHVACAAAAVVLKELHKKSLIINIEKVSSFFLERLHELQKKLSIITEVRGMGLHIGIEVARSGPEIVQKALDQGLIINCTAGNVIRFMPPLNIPFATAKAGMKIFENIVLEEEGTV